MRKCILDIGTNSLKLSIFEREEEKNTQIFHKKFENRLGKNFDHEHNLINLESLEEVIQGLKEIKNIAKDYGIEESLAFWTEVFRKAKNTPEATKKIKEETWIEIQILSQEKELDMYWKGLMKDFNYDGIIAAIDIWGGSVQFMYGDKNWLQGKHLYPTGTLFLREKFIKQDTPTEEEFEEIEKFISNQIQDLDIIFPQGTPFIHGSGSVINFFKEAGIKMQSFSHSPTHPYLVPIETVETFYKEIRCFPREERSKLFPSNPQYLDGAPIGFSSVTLIAKKTWLTNDIPSNNTIVNGFL